MSATGQVGVLRWGIGVAVLALACAGCGSDCNNGSAAPEPFIAVLSAFPAELAAVLEHETVDETVDIEGRTFRIGTIAGVHVIAGMTRIGLINAATTTRALLDQYPVTGVVFSGVAGSSLRIADVAAPDTWRLADGSTYPAHAPWLQVARRLAAKNDIAFERCTVVASTGSPDPVCLPHDPALFVGGIGDSSDTFGDMAFPCQANGGEVFGCDPMPAAATASFARQRTDTPGPAPEESIVVDNETAAVARETAASGVPFIGFRGVSDGADDPLGLPGFPAQFYAYYRLSAHNAAAAAAAFIAQLGPLRQS